MSPLTPGTVVERVLALRGAKATSRGNGDGDAEARAARANEIGRRTSRRDPRFSD
jgi:hypothetical protein